MGLPVTVAEARETGALGAAIGAAVALGEVTDYEEGIDRMTRLVRTFAPQPALAAHYATRYDTYNELIAAMGDVWSTLAATRAAEGDKR
ncbi:MAG: hypothetical protein AcusKO_01490 [Acuticoccus sp.]